jgi:hypothetical protein
LKLSEAFNEAAAKAATMATASIAIPPQPGTAVSGALRAAIVRMYSSGTMARVR